MSRFELKLPKMGESVAEATITAWLKEVGETIELDEAIVEIATDKVDSEVPSEVEGVLVERLFEVDDVVGVGQVIAVIETNGAMEESKPKPDESAEPEVVPEGIPTVESVKREQDLVSKVTGELSSPTGKFYSPLVKNIARTEGISLEELEAIPGTGKDQRVTKKDVFAYLESRKTASPIEESERSMPVTEKPAVREASVPPTPAGVSVSGEGDEIIEMTRMGKLISKHMVESLQTSAHVQSFVEVDVTNIVRWRERIKDDFFKRTIFLLFIMIRNI